MKCRYCNGKGVIPNYSDDKCDKCDGWGKVGGGIFSEPHMCPKCNGSGKKVKPFSIGTALINAIFESDKCPVCKGTGKERFY